MDKTPSLLLAWRSFFVFKKHRSEPVWAQLLISTGIGMAFSAVMLSLVALSKGRLTHAEWWALNIPPNLLLSLSVSYCIHGLYRLIEWLLPEATIHRINGWRDWRSGLFFSAVPISGVVLGGAIGAGLIGALYRVDALGSLMGSPRNLLVFLSISVLLSAVNWVWWKLRWRQQALQLQATEAQLRLLQAQIEPHFLFNTLANVQSLIDHDTPRAKQMLEAFTDYLRASLSQLRLADSSLEAELGMAQSYLQLLQTRMGERLRFAIEVDPAVRAAVLPPLLLQPLIENAIHHGLEPQVEGGEVRISARAADGVLTLTVDDDGRGLTAPRRPGRAGSGMALDNIRARLKTRYADAASLSLQSLERGTRAVLTLPYTAQP